MLTSLQGENYTADFYLFLVIYPLNHEENSDKFEKQFQCFFQIQLDSWRSEEVRSGGISVKQMLNILVMKDPPDDIPTLGGKITLENF